MKQGGCLPCGRDRGPDRGIAFHQIADMLWRVMSAQSRMVVQRLTASEHFAAVFPVHAVVKVCVACHDRHRCSPRHALEAGVVVIRIPME